MFRFILFLLIALLATETQAQVDGAMVVQGSVTEPEKPLTMAGGLEINEPQLKQIQEKVQGGKEEFDAFLFEQIRKSGIYRNPSAVKKAYAHLKAIEMAVREEQEKQLAKIPEDDKEGREKLKRQMDIQAPVRFQPFDMSDAEVNDFINKKPELAMYFIMKSSYGPDIGLMTEEEQKTFINRPKERYKAHYGYNPDEYIQKYIETRVQEREQQNLKGQPLAGDTIFIGDGQIEKSEEKK